MIFLKVGAVFILLTLLLVYFLQEKLIFFPQPVNPDTAKRYQDYAITLHHGKHRLQGWYIQSKHGHNSPLLVYFGGNAEELSNSLDDYHNFPDISLLFMNYRGFGDSEGRPSQSALFEDAVYILDQITISEKIPMNRVILLGRSLGSSVAAHVAHKRKVAGVILVTPFDSLIKIAQNIYPFLPVKSLLKHPFNSIEWVGNIQAPLLAVVASQDEIIPRANSLNLVDHWHGPKELVIIDAAGHNDIQQYKAYWRAINSFIEKVNNSWN